MFTSTLSSETNAAAEISAHHKPCPPGKKKESLLLKNINHADSSQTDRGQMASYRSKPAQSWLEWLRSLITPTTPDEEYQSVLTIGGNVAREARELRDSMESAARLKQHLNIKGSLLLAGAALLGGGAGFAFGRFCRTEQNATDIRQWTNSSGIGEFTMVEALAERDTSERFLPYETSMRNRRPYTDQTTETPIRDDVQIKKMFDLDCIKVRDNMSFADWLQTLGETLSSPVKKLTEESAVVHAWNKGEGCPTAEQLQELQRITVPIDVVVSTILGFLPGSQPLNILQGLVGPMLELVAADIRGDEPDLEKRNGVTEQLIFMARQSIPNLSTPERSALLDKMQDKTVVDKTAQDIVKKRFTFKDGRTHVSINNINYPLLSLSENIPMVTDDSGIDRFIRYNQKYNRWEFTGENNFDYLIEDNYIKKELYGLKLKNKDGDYTLSILSDPNHSDLFLLTRDGKPDLKGIFIDDLFIPVKQIKVGDQWVMTAYSPSVEDETIVLETEYGWMFEQSSAPMGNYLQLLLESEGSGFHYRDGNRFKPIAEDGFSYDDRNKKYIKQNSRYYHVEEVMNSGVYSAMYHPTSTIVRDNNIFRLKKDEDMLFGALVTPVGANVLKGSAEEYIESGAAYYLSTHGDTKLNQPPYVLIHPGIYLDKNHNTFFMVGDKYYSVVSHTDKEIKIERSEGNKKKGEIILKLIGDTWVRVRNGVTKETFQYEEINSCRVARSPGNPAWCVTIFMEKKLAEMLSSIITRGGSSSTKSILDSRLTEYKIFGVPNLYVDPVTFKYYFLYQGHYFSARITHGRDSSNPTGLYLVHLYKKGSFFSTKRYVTSIVADRNGNRIELKTQETFLAEELNVSKKVAKKFIESRPYRYIGGINILEDAVIEVLASGRFYTSQPREIYKSKITDDIIKEHILQMFPDRVLKNREYAIKTYTLGTITDDMTPLQIKAQRYVKESIRYLKRQAIPALDHMLHFDDDNFNWQPCIDFLSEVLGTTSQKQIIEFSSMLRKRLKRINNALDENKIRLVAAVKKGKQVDPLDLSLGVMTESERHKGTIAFMSHDRDSHIYISTDKTYSDNNAEFKPAAAMMTVLLHEASHAGSMTYDFVYTPRDDGHYVAAWEAVADLALKIRDGQILSYNKFKQITIEYLQSISVYRNKLPEELSNEQLFYLFNNDPGYRAHILLNSADSLALIISNIYEAEVFGNMRSTEEEYSQVANFKALDRFGTIFDNADGTIIKDYGVDTRSGTKTYLGSGRTKFESRAQVAMHNVNCINRLYGDNAASLVVNTDAAKIIIKLPKIPGNTLYTIYHMDFAAMQKEYKTSLARIINSETNPADILTEKLISKGIIYEKISLSDLMFDKEKGFSVLNFDAADLLSEGEEFSAATKRSMLKKIRLLIASFALYVGLPYEEIAPKLGVNSL